MEYTTANDSKYTIMGLSFPIHKGARVFSLKMIICSTGQMYSKWEIIAVKLLL